MSRILVIDDEKYIREWHSIKSSVDEYEVSTEASCYELRNKIRLYRPDIVILNIGLIDCDVLELLREIRECYPDLWIITCRACDSYRSDIKAIAALVKSFDLTELKIRVERALEARIPYPPMAAG